MLTSAIVAKATTALSPEEKLRLLRKAVPFKAGGRQLQDNNGNSYLTATDSIQFNSCVSLTAMPEEEDQEFIASSDDMKTLFENGDIVSQKSVVLFSICAADQCSYEAEDNLFVTDLDAYLQLTSYQPQKTFDYCEACQEAEQWCLYDQYQQAEGEGEDANADNADNADAENADNADAENADNAEGDAAAEDGGRRRLSSISRKLSKQYVDCGQCEALGCYVDEEAQQNNGGDAGVSLEDRLEWVKQQSECYQTGQYWNDLPLYSSFMCNEAGNGVEIALFLDDNCGLYLSQVSYASIFPNDQYVTGTQDIVTYPFNYDVNCSAEIEWSNPEEQQNQDANAEEEADDQEDAGDANEFCQQLVDEGDILPLSDCGASNGNNQNNNNQNNNNQNENNEYYSYFSGFTYNLMGKDDAENPYVVCTALQAMQGEYSSFKKTNQKYNVYKQDSEHSGQNYQYKPTNSKAGLSGGAIAGIVIAVAVACAAAFVAVKFYKKKKDSKREPLVSSEGIGA